MDGLQHRWKDDDEAPPMTGTLESYCVLAGDPDEMSGDQ